MNKHRKISELMKVRSTLQDENFELKVTVESLMNERYVLLQELMEVQEELKDLREETAYLDREYPRRKKRKNEVEKLLNPY